MHEETLFKVQADVSALGVSSDGLNRFFRASVVAVDADAVAYATVKRGIGFELADEADALPRWKQTIRTMRGLTE